MIRSLLAAMRRSLFLVVTAACCAAAASAQQRWAYQPLQRPAVPAAAWGDAPIDRFVAAKLVGTGLQPSPPATRAAWLRRAALDLRGLPPTVTELDAFLADTAPDAKARAADALMAGPAFGERWAQWWLDLARYADSQGYEKDDLRPSMWRWREWVIDAFAAGMPLDQFTVEQLAGDLLPDATIEQRLATAFHRQTMTNTEGGTDDEEFRSAAVVDRVDTTMQVWMGSTLGCAQCHDHKYDRFSQREFFQLYAYFDQTEDSDRGDDEPKLLAPTPAQRRETARLEGELATARRALAPEPAAVAAWADAQAAQLRAFAAAAPQATTWQALGPLPAGGMQQAHARAFAPERDGVQLAAEQDGQRWREEPAWRDGAVHSWRGDGAAMYLFRTVRAASAASAVLSLGRDDAIKAWWNGVEVLARADGGAAAPDQALVPVALQPGDNTLLLKVSNGGGVAGFYFDLRASELPADVQAIAQREPAARDDAQRARLAAEFVVHAAELAPARAQVAALEAELAKQRGPAVPVLRELPTERRRTTRIHRRGSFLDPGDPVQPGLPAVWASWLGGAPSPSDRLGFARWLVAPANPLTPRVLANRLWSELFGQGLVTTLEDFGAQGELPSHPELLDWLACELRDGGWSLRGFLKQIVLSATYGQSSSQTPAHREHDPYNRLLARGATFRLSAETLRDQALAVAGVLTPTIGGPSVMPPQPDGVWLQMYSGAQWRAADGPDRYRRALYTFWRRTSPHPAMMVFDAQSREACVLRRPRTNTPLQALVLWNDPQFREPALALARLAREAATAGADDAAGVDALWRRCLCRAPSAGEHARTRQLLADERARFAAAPQQAEAIAGLQRADAGELAAWSVLASVVLALDEFVTRR